MRQATLLFLIQGDNILLAMKKRGFGEGQWNGVGGKPEKGETLEETAIRECQEEIEVTPLSLKHMADLKFYFPEADKDWNQEVKVYICHSWQGDPAETEEMAPKWFKISDIPYEQMWEDDKFWLPKVLAGKFAKGKFHFDEDKKLTRHSVNAE